MRRGGKTAGAGVYPGLYSGNDAAPTSTQPPVPPQASSSYVEPAVGNWQAQQPQAWTGNFDDYNPNAMSWAPVSYEDTSARPTQQASQAPATYQQGNEALRSSAYASQSQQNQANPYGSYAQPSNEPYRGSIFTPKFDEKPSNNASYDDPENEPPLLEELGINFDHIRQKTLAVVNPFRKVVDDDVLTDSDLSGPLVFCLAFGAALLLAGKVHFGYVYGIGLLGCLGMFALLNLMNVSGIPFLLTVSILGYSLLPIVSLAVFAVFVNLTGIFGIVLATTSVFWSSLTAAKLFVGALHMEHALPLVAYPCLLVYAVFALLAVF